jgi:uncharacterized protein YggL (DUF469 family)
MANLVALGDIAGTGSVWLSLCFSYMRGLHAQNPDAHITVGDTLIDDGIAMYEWTMTGTDQGELTGMSKTRIEDGSVIEDRIYQE